MDVKEPMNCGKKTLKFKVLGEAVGQGRPRFARMGKFVQAYDPKASSEEKATVRLIAQQAVEEQQWAFPSPDMPIRLEITSYRKVPRGRQLWYCEAARLNIVAPLTKPDNDNVLKLYMDAMSGVVYPDDKQVFDIRIAKVFSEQSYTEVEVTGYFQSYGEIKALSNASLKAKREQAKQEGKNGQNKKQADR